MPCTVTRRSGRVYTSVEPNIMITCRKRRDSSSIHMAESKRKIWRSPWGYLESVIIVAGIVAAGFILQAAVGGFDLRLMRWPVNIIIGGIIVSAIILMTFLRWSAFSRWFSGTTMAVTLIGALVTLGIVMGLTPQVFLGTEPVGGTVSRFGLDNLTSSWAFVTVYLLTLLSLGAVIARRLTRFSLRDYAFILNHLGLWLLLFAAGLGSADRKNFVMHVREGETEWRVYNENDDMLELPIAIELNDFNMEEYPPSLTVVDRATGAVQPEGKPEFFAFDGKITSGSLAGWEVNVEEYIHDAVRNSDSTYHEIHMPGASPAAKVSVRRSGTGEVREGWVSAGNMSQLFMVLNLDDRHALAMTKPAPKRFVSDIIVYTENGRSAHALLEVNKPLRIGGWMLYQYGYDNEAGRLSTYSSIEMVYDPWVIPVYVGIVMLMAGSVCMLWMGNRRKEVRDDVE